MEKYTRGDLTLHFGGAEDGSGDELSSFGWLLSPFRFFLRMSCGREPHSG